MINPYVYCNSAFDEKLSEEGFWGYYKVLVYSDDKGSIYLLIDDEELGWMGCYSVNTQSWVDDEDIYETLRPAMRKEVQAAGLWDCVFNKDDYSSKEDQIQSELDEYLRIGEELSKTKDLEEKLSSPPIIGPRNSS